MPTLTVQLTRACFVPTAGRLSLLASRGVVSAALRARTPPVARRARQIGTRSYSSKSHPANDGMKYANLVPVIAVTTSLALGIVMWKRGPGAARMDLTPPITPAAAPAPAPKCHACVDEPSSEPQPRIMISAADPSIKAIEPVGDGHLEVVNLPREKAILTNAPHVPPVITRDYAALVQVPLVTTTKLAQLTSKFKYEQWTFNGTVPGPFIRVREGDVVELTLTNKDTAGNPHNIDCHAFTGPGGGAAVTTAEENETKTARFKLLYPGLYVYHCAAAPVPVHIANGMYGLLYVQPKEGDLPPVDKEYYVMQSEWYHEPPEVDEEGRRSETVEFSYPNGLREEPQVVTFNGNESALTRDKPLKANVGDSVRLFFGNAGPNLTSSFHVIGSHFKNVYRDGDVISPPGRAVQTVPVPAGGSSIFDLQMEVPGTYTLVDHAIFRLDKGAVGFLNVSGKQNPAIYQSTQPPRPCVGCKLHA
ncbi:copper-containing nitrite reductase [Dactylonectria estremocensis]|uniref:Copper-containing nitrite reductase n=1 Tax=Dactylonectria estremocensis TaxID=1079267 RepID=A0A9P9EEK7_9HYPO|nr:copper-containing nitrite reductase [Dactylonectria estremocensis]